ncbi:MAG: methyltransferase [Paracoccaceae bacterium]
MTTRLILGAELTRDAFLGGKLHVLQPKKGYRAGVDPVLLAASVPGKAGQTVLDLGCGVGTAALCLGARVPDMELTGVERDPFYADLARQNGLSCHVADLTNLPLDLRQQRFDHVLANPPYFDRSAGKASEDARREGALGEETPLSDWIKVAAKRLKPKGFLHLIHKAQRLPDILTCVCELLGSVEVLPLVSRTGRDAELIILRARKEGRAKFQLHSPLVMHTGSSHKVDGDDYTKTVSRALRFGDSLNW